jgi:hypothetical protein
VTPPASSPSPHDPTLIDDFTLPDAVIEELEEVAKSEPHDTLATVDAPPATKTASSAENKSAHEPAAAGAPRPTAKAAPAHGGKAGGNGAASTVNEPQYAFNASEIKDMFNVPLFIPGAVNAGINVEELDFGGLNPEQPHDAADTGHEQPHYDAERVFYQSAEQSGIKPGWYFTLRGGKTHGPFGSKEASARVLNEMIEQFKRTGDTGGR